MDEKKLMWKEFCMLVDRCGCSRASLRLTQDEIDRINTDGSINITPVEPSCTPERCFPTLYKYLHPKGAHKPQSHKIQKGGVEG